MSATTENIMDEIKRVENEIVLKRTSGESTSELETSLKNLVERLQKSQEALNESRILKG